MAEFALNKDLTIGNIKEIHKGLVEHIEKFNHLSLTIGPEIDIDFSGVQLMQSLITYINKIEKSISIQWVDRDQEMNPFSLADFGEILKTKIK